MLKKTVFICLLFFITIAFIEIGSFSIAFFVGFDPAKRESFYKTRVASSINSGDNVLGRWSWPDEIADPYFGYGIDYSSRPLAKEFGVEADYQINNYHFRSSVDYPYKKNKDEFVIGVFGGSFAFNWVVRENQTNMFADRLPEKIGELKNKKIILLNMSQGGFKQPQSYFVLAYFVEMFDAVIFLDGFNDFALKPKGGYPLEYPIYSSKLYRQAKSIEDKIEPLVNRTKLLRKILVKSFELGYFHPWLHKSNFYYLIDRLLSESLSKKIISLNSEIEQIQEKEESPFQPAGLTEGQQHDLALKVWSKYTRLSHNLTAQSKIKMFHYIQPNQYLDEKPLTDNELKIASDPAVKAGTAAGYGSLFREEKKLRKEHLEISDELITSFRDVHEDLYIDKCCHINDRGNDLLTEKIILSLQKNWKNK